MEGTEINKPFPLTAKDSMSSGEMAPSDYNSDNDIFLSIKNYSSMENQSLFSGISATEFTNQTSNATLASGGRDEDLAKIEIAVLAVIFVLTVLGNFIVLTGIYFRCQKMTRMYYFILHLSIADLITAFFNVLTQLFWELTYRFQGGNVLCKFIKYAQILGPYSSSYVLVMTALDRYQAICYPLSNCSWTARRSKLMLATAWTLALLFCIPQSFIFSYQEPWPDSHPGIYDCWATFIDSWGAKAYVTWYCITVFIIPLMILIFAYSCICRAIWLNFSIKNAIRRHEGTSKRMSPDSDGEETENNINDHDPGLRDRKEMERFPKNSINKHYPPINTREDDYARGLKFSVKRQDTLIDNGRKISTSISQSNPRLLCQSTSEVHLQSEGYSRAEHSDNQAFISTADANQHNNKSHPRGLPSLDSNDKIEEIARNGNSQLPLMKNGNDDINSNGRLDSSLIRPDKSKKDPKIKKIYKWYSPSKLEKRNQNGNGERHTDKLFRQDSEIRSGSISSGSNRRPSCKQLLLVPGKSLRKKSINGSKKTANSVFQPRTNSVKGISRAKIKTVKLTVTVICCYIFCSSPFIAAQLWFAYDPYATLRPFYSGATFTILTLLASLNSCVNPWIFLFFNPNLLQDFIRGFCRSRYPRQNGRGSSPNSHTLRTSPGFSGKSFRSTNRSIRAHLPNTQPSLPTVKALAIGNNRNFGNTHNNVSMNLKNEKFHDNIRNTEPREGEIFGESSKDNCVIPTKTDATENRGNNSLIRETSFISATGKRRGSSALWQCD